MQRNIVTLVINMCYVDCLPCASNGIWFSTAL